MKIVLASNNKNKIAEFNSILKTLLPEYDIDLVSLSDIGYTKEIVEDGNSFEENALIKARAVSDMGMISISDDSGIEVDALDGAPGIHSARYAGMHGNDKKNNEKLLRELNGVPYEKRTAHYVCTIACVMPGEAPFTVTGYTYGHILTEEHGDGGFGYDPLFLPDGQSLTWGQLPEEIKNQNSHRRTAIELFAEELKKRLK